jgi:hypothetical protein
MYIGEEEITPLLVQVIRQARDRLVRAKVKADDPALMLCSTALRCGRDSEEEKDPLLTELVKKYRARVKPPKVLVWLTLKDAKAAAKAAKAGSAEQARFSAIVRFIERASTERELLCDCRCTADCACNGDCYCPCSTHESEEFEKHAEDYAKGIQ